MEEIEGIFAVERGCFDKPWTPEMLRSEIDSPLSVIVCESRSGKTAAFALGRVAADEAELFRIGTLEEFRGRGIAGELLERLHEKMREKGATACFLEVRSKNAAAISLYKKHGYEQISVRKGYYGDDDALIMKRIFEETV